jgi:hypothetical protein
MSQAGLSRLLFAGKAGAYPSIAPLRYSTLGQAPGLNHKHYSWLERSDWDKYSGLLKKYINYNHKKFNNITPWSQAHETFNIHNLLIFVTI